MCSSCEAKDPSLLDTGNKNCSLLLVWPVKTVTNSVLIFCTCRSLIHFRTFHHFHDLGEIR